MAEVPDALRVSVVGGHERVDLVVPAAVSVAELLPELTRRLGPRDPLAEVRLSVVGGPPLSPGAGLAAQGVPDGAVLTVTEHAAPLVRTHDDLARAVAEAVEAVPRPGPGVPWWCGVALAAALLGSGAVGSLVLGTVSAAATSAATAGLLMATAALASRRDRSAVVVAGTAWLAVAHAAAAALTMGVVAAGAGLAATGAVAVLVVRRVTTLWAAVVAGGVIVMTGLVAGAVPALLPLVLTCALVLVVVTGDLLPWLAATVAGLVPPPLGEEPPRAPDPAAVDAGVRRAHDVLLVSTVATGLLLVVLGPVVAVTGPWGVAVVLLCCVVVVLRSRRHRVGPSGLAGLLGGLVPLLPVAGAVGWRWPDGRATVLAGVVGAGLLALAAVVLPAPRTARAGRVAELAEALALVALPPSLLAATGLLDLVREVVG